MCVLVCAAMAETALQRIFRAIGAGVFPFYAVDGTPEAASTENMRPAQLDATTLGLRSHVVASPPVRQGQGDPTTPWYVRGVDALGVSERLAAWAQLPAALVSGRLAVNSTTDPLQAWIHHNPVEVLETPTQLIDYECKEIWFVADPVNAVEIFPGGPGITLANAPFGFSPNNERIMSINNALNLWFIRGPSASPCFVRYATR